MKMLECLGENGIVTHYMISIKSCCLFELMRYVPVNKFSVMLGCFPRLNQYKQ